MQQEFEHAFRTQIDENLKISVKSIRKVFEVRLLQMLSGGKLQSDFRLSLIGVLLDIVEMTMQFIQNTLIFKFRKLFTY